MLLPKIEYSAVTFTFPAGTAAKLEPKKVVFEPHVTHVIGMAVFTRKKPASMTDYQVSFGETQRDYFPLVTKDIFESKDIAPKDKFASVLYPCKESITNIAKVETDMAIPANESLEVQIVFQSVNLEDYNRAMTAQAQANKQPAITF